MFFYHFKNCSLIIYASLLTLVTYPSFGSSLKVLTTIPDLAAIVSELGDSSIEVDSFCKGTQDPHYLEAKPSYMVKARSADLVIALGLDLEIGWLPSIIQGSRNPEIRLGQKGYLEIGPQLSPIEKANGPVSRAQGDVHPNGNPHLNLDPIRMGDAALIIAKKLGELDTAHSEQYKTKALVLQKRLQEKTKLWQERITKTQVKKVISFHKTLTYFFARFGIENPAILEPLPGIPPTAAHLIEVIDLAKTQKIPLIMVENFFSPDAAKRVTAAVPTMRMVIVPVGVGGEDGIKTIDDLYESLVNAIEGKK